MDEIAIYLCIGFSYLLAIYAIGSHLKAAGQRYPRIRGDQRLPRCS